MAHSERAWLLGLPVDLVTRDEAVARIRDFVSSRRPHLVITADASALVLARTRPDFRDVFRQASLVTADGAGVVRALQWQGRRLRERCSGVDLVSDIAGVAATEGWRIFLLGGAPGVADAAAAELARRFPGLQVAGTNEGFFPDDAPIIDKVRGSGADILLVAMGMPKQELWFWKHRDQLGAKVGIGVGGTFDVLSGTVKRAPPFFQKHGLEWLYRSVTNPSRYRKLANLPVFLRLARAEARRKARLAKRFSKHKKKLDN